MVTLSRFLEERKRKYRSDKGFTTVCRVSIKFFLKGILNVVNYLEKTQQVFEPCVFIRAMVVNGL